MKATTATLWAACLGYSMVILDTTVLNVALPSIAAETGSTLTQQQWIIDSYVLVMTALLLAGGGLIDRFGATRIFRAGVIVFGIASAICALAGSPELLITARALQGVGGAMLIPATLATVMAVFTEPEARGRAIAVIATVTASPQAFGPTFGGVLVDTLGWRSLFLLNIPVAVVTLFFARALPRTAAHKRPLDITGVLLVVLSLGALTYGIISLTAGDQDATGVIACFVVALTAAIAFVTVERRAKSPLLPGPVLASPKAHLYVLAGTFMFILFYGALFAANLYFQNVLGLTALASGLLLLPAGFPVFALPLVVSRFTKKKNPATVTTAGVIISTLGAVPALLAPTATDPYLISASLLIVGIGSGISSPPHLSLAMSVAPPGTAGVISALANAGRQAGYLLGVALVVCAGTGGPGYQTATAITILGGLLAVGALLAANKQDKENTGGTSHAGTCHREQIATGRRP